MILDMNGCISTNIHSICISNYKTSLFLVIYPKLAWSDKISFARTFETMDEALDFVETPLVKVFLENELEQFIWIDTKQPIY